MPFARAQSAFDPALGRGQAHRAGCRCFGTVNFAVNRKEAGLWTWFRPIKSTLLDAN